MKACVILVITMVFFAMAAYYSACLDGFNNKINYVNSIGDSSLSAPQALENQRQVAEFGPVTYWTKRSGATVSSPTLGSVTVAEVITVCGRTDLLFSSGAWLDYDQQDKCLLGYGTASQLFGSRNVVGLNAELDGKSFQVAGVLPQVKDGFVYEAGSKDAVLFDRMTVICESSGRQFVRNQVAGQYPDSVELDYEVLLFFSRILLLSVPFLILGTLLSGFGKGRWIGYVALLCLFVNAVDFPTSLIPPRWSDFTFWAVLWERKQEGMLLFFREAMGAPDLVLLVPYGKMMLCSFVSLLLICYLKREGVFRHGSDYLGTHWKNLWKKDRRSGRVQSGD